MWRAIWLEKTLMLAKMEGRRRGQWRRWFDGIINSMDMSLSKRWEMVKDREAWRATVHEVTKSQTWLSDWTTTSVPLTALCISFRYLPFSTRIRFGFPVAFRHLVSLSDLWLLLVSVWPQHFGRIDQAFCRLACSLSCPMCSCDLGRMLQGRSACTVVFTGIYSVSRLLSPLRVWFFGGWHNVQNKFTGGVGLNGTCWEGVLHYYLNSSGGRVVSFISCICISIDSRVHCTLWLYPALRYLFCSTDCFSFDHWASFRWAFVCRWHTLSFVLWSLPSFLAPQGRCPRLILDFSALALPTFFPKALVPFSGEWYLETRLEHRCSFSWSDCFLAPCWQIGDVCVCL